MMLHRCSPYVWMLFGAAAFALMAVLASELRVTFTWQWIAAARSGLAMLFAATLVLAAGKQFLIVRPATLWWRSLAGSISLLLGFFALTHYDVAVILTLTNMYPLWVAVLSWPMLGVRPGVDTWCAAIVGVVGVAVLMGVNLPYPLLISSVARHGTNTLLMVNGWKANEAMSALAVAAAIVSAFTSALALVSLHRLRHLDHRAVVVHFSATAFVFCLLAAWLLPVEKTVARPTFISWAMLLGVGASATVGQLLLTKAFAHGEPGKVSVVGLSQICFALLFKSLWHGQHYTARTLTGMTLVILPTAWVMWRSTSPADRFGCPKAPALRECRSSERIEQQQTVRC